VSQPFQPIPHEELRAGFRGCVHVEGWNPACVFRFIKVTGIGEYLLQTPKTKRTYFTGNRLLYTRGNQPSFSATSTPSATHPLGNLGQPQARPVLELAALAGSSLETDHHSHAVLTSKTPRPEQTVDHPFAEMTKAAQH